MIEKGFYSEDPDFDATEIVVRRNRAHQIMLGQTARYYYQVGGRWSAKTTETLIHFVLAMQCNPGLRIAIFRKTYDSIRDSIYADMLQIIEDMGVAHLFTVLKSPFCIESKTNRSKCIFKGATDPDRMKGLAGVHWAFLEELNEFTEMDFETIDKGLRGKGYKKRLFMAHNPVPRLPGEQYWFERKFAPRTLVAGEPRLFKVPGIGIVSALKTTYQQNAFTPRHVREALEGYKYTNPALYNLWTLGDYAEVKGLILTNWDERVAVPTGADLIGYGLDFGFANDPTACIAVYGNRREIWLKEILYHTGLTAVQIADKLKHYGVERYDRIIADSADPRSIQEIYDAGLRGIKGAKKSPNYKTEMANVLQGKEIHIIEGGLNLKREIQTWSWDEDKFGNLIPRPRDGNDHLMDALVMLTSDYEGNRPGIAGLTAM